LVILISVLISNDDVDDGNVHGLMTLTIFWNASVV
jgi:hypothetical protein